MVLSAKEREKIVEEERLRYETRQALHKEHCAKHRPSRWFWWVAVVVLAYLAWCHVACRGSRCLYHGAWMGGSSAQCWHHGDGADAGKDSDDKVEPGQPLPPKR